MRGRRQNFALLIDQKVHGPIADVLSVEQLSGEVSRPSQPGHTPLSVSNGPNPRCRRWSAEREADIYARRGQTVSSSRHRHGEVTYAVIEIVSTGQQRSRRMSLRKLVEKSEESYSKGVHIARDGNCSRPTQQRPQGIPRRSGTPTRRGRGIQLQQDKPLYRGC